MSEDPKTNIAKLKILLMANEVQIAESFDPLLWHKTFAAMTGAQFTPKGTEQEKHEEPRQSGATGIDQCLEELAKDVNVTIDIIKGAMAPRLEQPFVHLNAHNWEALKRHTPKKGPGSVSPSRLASTLLALWFKHCKKGNPEFAQIQAVIETIGLKDNNVARGPRLCEWLQIRNGTVALNPAEMSKAVNLVRAYCKKTPLEEKS